METLEKLFGSASKVKIMKLFLFNKDKIFDKEALIEKTKISSSSITKEINLLEKIGFLKKKSFFKEGKKKANGSVGKKKRVCGYLLNLEFKYLSSLQRMLVDSTPMEHKEITNRLSNLGKVKLVIVSGLFIHTDESRVDLLVVGDDISEKRFKTAISNIEADIGHPLRYSLFHTEDFKYRIGMCDRLVRDIFDYPHEVVVDKIGL